MIVFTIITVYSLPDKSDNYWWSLASQLLCTHSLLLPGVEAAAVTPPASVQLGQLPEVPGDIVHCDGRIGVVTTCQ